MSAGANLHWIASVAAKRLLFSLGIGTLLALVVWFLLRFLPKRDSRTSFAVWFSTLLITAALPLIGLHSSHAASVARPAEAVITISTSWAVYVFVGLAAIALAGLARVAPAPWEGGRVGFETGVGHLRFLNPRFMGLFEKFQRSR